MYIIEQRDGRWSVYRVVPIGLTAPGRVWVKDFDTEAEAQELVDQLNPKQDWERELIGERGDWGNY